MGSSPETVNAIQCLGFSFMVLPWLSDIASFLFESSRAAVAHHPLSLENTSDELLGHI